MRSDIIRRHAFRKILISLTILLVLLTVSDSLAAGFKALINSSDDKVEINLTDASNSYNTDLIYYNHIDLFKEAFPKGAISFMSEAYSTLAVEGTALHVKVDLTDEAYFSYSGLKITQGAYFGADALKYGRNVAVISEKMAEQLFMSLNAVGNEIRLFDESYVIVGLYRKSETLTSFIGSDGYERIYVPFTSHKDMENLPINTVFIQDKSLIKEKFKQNTIGNILIEEIGIDVSAYRIIDYYRSETMVSQWLELFLFIVAIWIGIMLLKAVGMVMQKIIPLTRNYLKENYFFEFIRKKYLFLISFAGAILLLLGGAVVIFMYARPHIFIPEKYIPQDNIFDMGFYLDRIKDAVYSANAMRTYVPTLIEQSFHSSAVINALIAMLMIPVLISLNSGLKLLSSLCEPLKAHAKVLILSYASALLLIMLISSTGVIDLVFPLKSIIVVSIFLIVNIVTRSRRFHGSLPEGAVTPVTGGVNSFRQLR